MKDIYIYATSFSCTPEYSEFSFFTFSKFQNTQKKTGKEMVEKRFALSGASSVSDFFVWMFWNKFFLVQ